MAKNTLIKKRYVLELGVEEDANKMIHLDISFYVSGTLRQFESNCIESFETYFWRRTE